MKWKEEIYNHEVTPPSNVWDKIIKDLDSGDFVVFKQKLFHSEETPPVEAWRNIKTMLSEPKVIPLGKKNNMLVKMLAAAACIGIMFFSVNYFFMKDDSIEPATAKTQPSEKAEKADSLQEDTPAEAADNPQPEYTVAAIQTGSSSQRAIATGSSFYEYENFDNTLSAVTLKQEGFSDRMDMAGGLNKKIRNLKGEIREDVSLLDLPNSYFMMTGPNGQSLRVSSKFRNTIQYLNSEGREEMLDVILRESQYWKSIFRDWKTRVGNSSFVPSVDNFMDIAELMELIQEAPQSNSSR
ncbi:MAG: hypothetical protein KIT80_09755 [Chitinophagaceae bacterium]|nr:hypothetical protein [Chitinophagaceae bacterium]MCW5927184.1 hypothetical protein [Chitinophagaceae bacterium]